jgi:hypothetical protein
LEHLNNMGNDALWKVLANPAEVKYAYTADIESLVDEFPQSGIFRALLAGNGDKESLRHAAAYFNPAILYKLVNAPEELSEITSEQIAWIDRPQTVIANNVIKRADEVIETDHLLPETGTADEVENQHNPFGEIVDQRIPADDETVAVITEPEPIHYPAGAEEDTQQDLAAIEIEPAAPVIQGNSYNQNDIEDEVYDEIVSIEDISLEQLATYQSGSQNEPGENHYAHALEPDNYFVFDGEPIQSEESETFTPVNKATEADFAEAAANDNHDVSKYNDEKLPYTFMWWLDKTRREHAATYQPYIYNNTGTGAVTSRAVTLPPVKRTAPDELQQQYVENIFNLNAIDQLERSIPEKQNVRPADKKEDEIIKRFIQAEPHIKHPANINLDNENKAKKSSEDADEFVTETLARIYTEQMLYQKAIATYKKLMLKFPEKSLYFASQIQQLEKKPN